MVKTNQLNFQDQKFFVGIDTHKANWKVTIRSNGMLLKTFSMNPEPKELYSYLTRTYPGGTYFSVYEAGFAGYWIHRELVALGIKNIIVNPADVPTTNKEKDRKSDPIDSNKLSRELSNESLTGIYVPDTYQESIRVLSRSLSQYAKRSTQIKNRIKSLLSFSGVRCECDSKKNWSREFLKILSEIKFKEDNTAFVMKKHLEELGHIRLQRLSTLRQIRKISKENVAIKVLRTVPGIGVITAFALYAELVDMKRFSDLDHLASYVGLVPSTASSDKTELVRGITLRQNINLRFMLIESAWTAVRMDPVFTKRFNDLCKRMTKNRAIIRIAKKLLSRIRSVWLNSQEYVPGTIEVISKPKKELEIAA
jgi:transposase